MIGYINAFYFYTFAACAALPLALLVKTGGDTGVRRGSLSATRLTAD